MKGCLEFPSQVDLTIYLFDLNEEVSLSLGIMVYDSPKTNVNKCYIIMYFIHGMYKNKYSNNINDERKKAKLHPLLFII